MPPYQLVVSDEAELDLAEGYCWYEEQAQLGSAFMAVVGKQFEFVEENPSACPVVAHNIRRCVLQRFPYNIYYSITREFIDVLAVWHGSRDQKRLLAARLGLDQPE